MNKKVSSESVVVLAGVDGTFSGWGVACFDQLGILTWTGDGPEAVVRRRTPIFQTHLKNAFARAQQIG